MRRNNKPLMLNDEIIVIIHNINLAITHLSGILGYEIHYHIVNACMQKLFKNEFINIFNIMKNIDNSKPTPNEKIKYYILCFTYPELKTSGYFYLQIPNIFSINCKEVHNCYKLGFYDYAKKEFDCDRYIFSVHKNFDSIYKDFINFLSERKG